MYKRNIFRGALLSSVILLALGCSRTGDSDANYKRAIDSYSEAHPDCLWPHSKKFPVQVATSDGARTKGYDALTDAGLLTRTTAEKKVMIIASKQMNIYDVSDKGRSRWTQDTTRPGYGNFCYGQRHVKQIENVSVTTNSSGVKTARVDYTFNVQDVPNWAKGQEMQNAFPILSSTLAGTQTAQATLQMNGNNW